MKRMLSGMASRLLLGTINQLLLSLALFSSFFLERNYLKSNFEDLICIDGNDWAFQNGH